MGSSYYRGSCVGTKGLFLTLAYAILTTMRFFNFLKYNNAVPIGLFVLFGASTAAFAATPEAQQAVYNTQDTVVSVDNTYIVNADVENFQYQLMVTGITEDDELYHVSYSYQTIDLKDDVWQIVTKNNTLKFTKKELEGRDLGLEVTKQLGELIANEMKYLADVQKYERRNGESRKVVATEYAGLVGRFFDPTQKEFPGYKPVIEPPKPPEEEQTAAVANAVTDPTQPVPPEEKKPKESTVLSLQVLGENPVRVALGSEYRDLGALLSDPTDPSITYKAFVNGEEKVAPITVTSNDDAVFEIEYRAVDQNGIKVFVRRIVLFGDAPDPGTAKTFGGNRDLRQEEPPAEEPPAEEPPAEEPPAETPPAEEPPAEEPPAEEPPVEESSTPPAEEPAQ